MVNLIFAVLIAIMGIMMLVAPKKVTERPKSMIKSETGVRICGVVLILLAVATLFL